VMAYYSYRRKYRRGYFSRNKAYYKKRRSPVPLRGELKLADFSLENGTNQRQRPDTGVSGAAALVADNVAGDATGLHAHYGVAGPGTGVAASDKFPGHIQFGSRCRAVDGFASGDSDNQPIDGTYNFCLTPKKATGQIDINSMTGNKCWIKSIQGKFNFFHD